MQPGSCALLLLPVDVIISKSVVCSVWQTSHAVFVSCADLAGFFLLPGQQHMSCHDSNFWFMQLAKSQAALAAAKARFAQQQKENEEIAERIKRQRLGLPEPRPVYQEVTCISSVAFHLCTF